MSGLLNFGGKKDLSLLMMGLGLLGAKRRPQADRYLSGALGVLQDRKKWARGAEEREQAKKLRDLQIQTAQQQLNAPEQISQIIGSPQTEAIANPHQVMQGGTGLLGGGSMYEAALKMMAVPGYQAAGASLLGDYITAQSKAGTTLFDQDLKQRKLLKEYQGQVKPYVDKLLDMKGKFEALMSSAATKSGDKYGRGAADLAMIFNFAKMMDPTSVVREGEQVMIARSDGVFGYLQGLLNQIGPGKGSLSSPARQGLVAEAYRQLQAQSAPVVQQLGFMRQGFGDMAPLVINPEALNFNEYVENIELPTFYGSSPKIGDPLNEPPSNFDPNDSSTWPPLPQ